MILNKELSTSLEISDDGVFTGYASVFNGLDAVGDTITPQAYDNVLSKGVMPSMLFNHDGYELPIGKWEHLEVDNKGLKATGRLNLKLKGVSDIYESMKFGSINGLSVRILLDEEDITISKNQRFINNVKRLPEISVVTMPCDENARIYNVKSISDINNIRDFEMCLRDVGASKTEAKALISKAKALFAIGAHCDDDNREQKQLTELSNVLAQIKSTLNK